MESYNLINRQLWVSIIGVTIHIVSESSNSEKKTIFIKPTAVKYSKVYTKLCALHTKINLSQL